MKIICVGIGKTGTTSISKALRHLGYTFFDWEEQVFDFQDHWVDVFQNGAQLDVERVYQHADAIVDAPGNFFWEEILESFPESKVILSESEEDSWLKPGQSTSSLRGSDISQVFGCSFPNFKTTDLYYLFSFDRYSWLCRPQVGLSLA